ncbi:hypothetical protein [Granulicella aggregans]|uniref:hypothetical protein n=1 Tax=Granulicella aggregans TaxID=474949 RepID=UPI0021DFB2AA|nr:hypothetical protein [Granulicella aggregans]
MKFVKFEMAMDGGVEMAHEPSLEPKDQFAAEMDHFSLCLQKGLSPHTPGEEGLQDQKSWMPFMSQPAPEWR